MTAGRRASIVADRIVPGRDVRELVLAEFVRRRREKVDESFVWDWAAPCRQAAVLRISRARRSLSMRRCEVSPFWPERNLAQGMPVSEPMRRIFPEARKRRQAAGTAGSATTGLKSLVWRRVLQPDARPRLADVLSAFWRWARRLAGLDRRGVKRRLASRRTPDSGFEMPSRAVPLMVDALERRLVSTEIPMGAKRNLLRLVEATRDGGDVDPLATLDPAVLRLAALELDQLICLKADVELWHLRLQLLRKHSENEARSEAVRHSNLPRWRIDHYLERE